MSEESPKWPVAETKPAEIQTEENPYYLLAVAPIPCVVAAIVALLAAAESIVTDSAPLFPTITALIFSIAAIVTGNWFFIRRPKMSIGIKLLAAIGTILGTIFGLLSTLLLTILLI